MWRRPRRPSKDPPNGCECSRDIPGLVTLIVAVLTLATLRRSHHVRSNRAAFAGCEKVLLCIRERLYRLRLFQPTKVRALCQPRTSSPQRASVRGAGFQTRENASSCHDRATLPQPALAPMRTPNFATSTTAGRPPLSCFVWGHGFTACRKKSPLGRSGL